MTQVQVALSKKAKEELIHSGVIAKPRVELALLQLRHDPEVGIPLKGTYKQLRTIDIEGYTVVYWYAKKQKTIFVIRILE